MLDIHRLDAQNSFQYARSARKSRRWFMVAPLGMPEIIYARAHRILKISRITDCDMARIGRFYRVDCNVKDNC